MLRQKVVKVLSLKNDTVLAEKCVVANGFLSRFRGLLGKETLPAGEGLLLVPCNDIHMWFMKFPIDVVFVARGARPDDYRVTSIHCGVRPWKPLPVRDGRAVATLELPVGTVERCFVQPGDHLQCLS